MATIIHHTPGESPTSDSFVDIILGIILLLVIVGIFFFYALPAIERRNALPQNDSSSLDVNVNLSNEGAASPPAAAPLMSPNPQQ